MVAAADPYADRLDAPQGPARHAAAVVKSDTVDLATVTKGVWVGGAGNMVVIMADGTQVTITGIPAGCLLPICVSRILSTNTTATNMLALW